MKKLVATLSIIIAIVGILFFNTNSISQSNDNVDLSAIIAMNTANAESGETVFFGCAPGGTYCKKMYRCKSVIWSNKKCKKK